MKPIPFGRYLLLDKVAAGGMAEVWRGRLQGESTFQRIYAIKKILPHVAEDEDFIAMFTDEALITARLQHANIAQTIEFAKVDDTYYIAMEYVSGTGLKNVWTHNRNRKTPMPIELAAFIVSRVADGLDYAHNQTDTQGHALGIVHRDVSPQNVLLSWDGEVKLIDFGIAKAAEKAGHTRPGTLKGKFAYMAPEQIRGLPIDGRADVFAVGVVLYELLTGERGFSADSEFSLLEKVRSVDIRPPTVLNSAIPVELERIIYKALAKDREHRYQSAAAFSEDLQRFLMMRGRLPTRQDLATYLRTEFGAEFDKERARHEAYQQIPMQPPASQASTVGVQGALGAGNTALIDAPTVLTAKGDAPGGLATLTAHGARSTSDESIFSGRAEPTQTYAGAPPGNVRPAAQRGATAADRGTSPTLTGLEQKRGGRMGIAAAVVVVGLIVAAAAAAFFLKKPAHCTIVVTTLGATSASVRLDDRAPVTAEPSVTFDAVEPGNHTLIVESTGYITFTTTLVTTSNAPLLQVKAPLKRAGGKLFVSSAPPGAQVLLDGLALEKRTPLTIELEGDTLHELEFRLDAHKPDKRSDVKVAPGAEQSLKVRLLPDRLTIHVTSVPSGARVMMDGELIGDTPLTLERVPGDPPPVVELVRPGCVTKKTSVPLDTERGEQTFEVPLTCR